MPARFCNRPLRENMPWLEINKAKVCVMWPEYHPLLAAFARRA